MCVSSSTASFVAAASSEPPTILILSVSIRSKNLGSESERRPWKVEKSSTCKEGRVSLLPTAEAEQRTYLGEVVEAERANAHLRRLVLARNVPL